MEGEEGEAQNLELGRGGIGGTGVPSLSEMRPSLNDIVQSPPRRQNVGHVTVPHQQVVGDQVPLDHGTLDQVLGCLQRCGIGRGTCKPQQTHQL